MWWGGLPARKLKTLQKPEPQTPWVPPVNHVRRPKKLVGVSELTLVPSPERTAGSKSRRA
jgi:hypothetical protein